MNKLSWLLLVLFVFAVAMPIVYASDEEAVNILEFPDRLAVMMGIPLFAAQILATGLVTLIFIVIPVLAKNVMGTVIMGIISLSLCIALTWLSPFILTIVVLMVVVLLGAKMRDWVGGHGGGD